ncbi:MAG: hypothetical protein ACNA8H_02375, partial [Anaerolineales bacterium]
RRVKATKSKPILPRMLVSFIVDKSDLWFRIFVGNIVSLRLQARYKRASDSKISKSKLRIPIPTLIDYTN